MTSPDATDRPEQRHLRRIAWCFLLVVVTLPLVAFGGAWSFVLLFDLVVAVIALREALRLRALRG